RELGVLGIGSLGNWELGVLGIGSWDFLGIGSWESLGRWELRSWELSASESTYEPTIRFDPGNTRSVDPADARERSAARMGDRAADSAGKGRRAAGHAGFALSRVAPPRAAGLAQGAVDHDRVGARGQGLRLERCRPEAARPRAGELGPALERHSPRRAGGLT